MARREQRAALTVLEAFGIAATVAGFVLEGRRGLLAVGLAVFGATAVFEGVSVLRSPAEGRLKRLLWPPTFVLSAVVASALTIYFASASDEGIPTYRAELTNTYKEGRELWEWLEDREAKVVYLNVRIQAFFADPDRPLFISVEEPPGTKKDNSLALENGGTITSDCIPDDPLHLRPPCLALGLIVGPTPEGREDHLYYAHGEYYLVGHFAVGAASVEHMFSRYIFLRPVDAEAALG